MFRFVLDFLRLLIKPNCIMLQVVKTIIAKIGAIKTLTEFELKLGIKRNEEVVFINSRIM